MLHFQREAKQLAKVAPPPRTKVSLTPSITLKHCDGFYPKLVDKCTMSGEVKKKKPISVESAKTPSVPEGQPCTWNLARLER